MLRLLNQFKLELRGETGGTTAIIQVIRSTTQFERLTMKKSAFVVIYVAIQSMLAPIAEAGALYCSGGTVAQLSYHGKGTLYLRMSNMNTAVGICSFDGEWGPAGSLTGSTSASSCKALFSALLAAKLAGTTISQVLFDGDAVPTSCTAFGPWTAVNLRYLDI